MVSNLAQTSHFAVRPVGKSAIPSTETIEEIMFARKRTVDHTTVPRRSHPAFKQWQRLEVPTERLLITTHRL